MAAATAAR
uniref:Uncharacterized protein n=1 Tax=Arundo donax TaxID=35708 RepID=A0A0A9C5N5_ARUDO